MGLEELDARGIKYSVIDSKTGEFKIDKIKSEKKYVMRFLSLIYFLSIRMHEEPKEVDIATTESKHILIYPFIEEQILMIFTEKNSDYVYVKQNISTILKG